MRDPPYHSALRGFPSPDQVQLAIALNHAFDLPPVPEPQSPKPPPAYRACGCALKFIAMIRPAGYATRTIGQPARTT